MRPSTRVLQALGSASSRSKSIGFIGLGRMGSEMCSFYAPKNGTQAYNLFSKKFAEAPDTHFRVCDALPDASHSFVSNFTSQFPGAKIAPENTPSSIAAECATIITMLPSSPQVDEVYMRSGGIIPALRELSREHATKTLCIDSTTLEVSVAQAVAHEAVSTGASMVDAPVSGGVTGAKAGTLSFLVGGPEAAYALAAPVLAHMGTKLIHCGPSGAGLVAKICNNLVLGVQQIVVGEAMLLGHRRLGLDPAILARVINTSTGACWASAVNNPVPGALADKSPPCEREYDGGFATALMLKDMGLALSLAKANGLPLPLGEAAEEIYEGMVSSADSPYARKDFSSVYKYLETRQRD